jgi:hypothetical protein
LYGERQIHAMVSSRLRLLFERTAEGGCAPSIDDVTHII